MDGTTAYLWHGRLYAYEHAPDELLAHLRERGIVGASAEAVAAVTAVSAASTADVAAAAGVSHLREALIDAGFLTAADIANAKTAALTAVSGVGKATAAKLRAAAQEML